MGVIRGLSTVVSRAPSTDLRNVITPTADTIKGLVVKRFSAIHSDNLFEAQDETGAAMSAIGPAGRFYAPDGTAALPSQTFLNGTAMGMYRIGTNILGFSTAGAERARFSAAGSLVLANGVRIFGYNGLDEATFPTFYNAFNRTLTGTLTGSHECFHIDFQGQNSNASSATLYGMRLSTLFNATTASSALSAAIGGSFIASITGTGTSRSITSIEGGEFIAQATQTGTGAAVTNLVGGTFIVSFTGQNLAITNATQILLQAPNAPGSGTTVTNNWGIRIPNMGGYGGTQNAAIVINAQTAGANNYSILSEGGPVRFLAGTNTNLILALKGAASQSGDYLNVLTSADVVLFKIDSAGLLTATALDAATNAATVACTLGHNTSGTPAAGFGSEVRTQLQSSTTVSQDAAGDVTTWATATHATRKARRVFTIFDTAAREVLRLEADGSNAMIGVLGAGAVVRQTSGANLTNNVTSGGTTDQIDNWTDLTIYATDAAAIRNAVYQLARKVKQVNDALRLFGWLT